MLRQQSARYIGGKRHKSWCHVVRMLGSSADPVQYTAGGVRRYCDCGAFEQPAEHSASLLPSYTPAKPAAFDAVVTPIEKFGRGAKADHRQLRAEAPRVRDQAYRDSAQGRPCAVPGCAGDGVVLAHIRTGLRGGTSLKPSDDESDFLCFEHHSSQEGAPGPEWWVNNIYVPARKRAYRDWKSGK